MHGLVGLIDLTFWGSWNILTSVNVRFVLSEMRVSVVLRRNNPNSLKTVIHGGQVLDWLMLFICDQWIDSILQASTFCAAFRRLWKSSAGFFFFV